MLSEKYLLCVLGSQEGGDIRVQIMLLSQNQTPRTREGLWTGKWHLRKENFQIGII
jgi:hypothetical protein